MSYFLKITQKTKGKYLQIYDSFHVKGEKNNKSKCIKSLGYYDDLISTEIPDPIAYYKDYAASLNKERKIKIESDKIRKISDKQISFNFGNFILDSIINQIEFKKMLKFFSTQFQRRFDHSEVLCDLIKARIVDPKSKLSTFNEVIPQIHPSRNYELTDVYATLNDLGEKYKNIIELFNASLKKYYAFDTINSYFDCTNFYFEIDKEDLLRRKGPSKENRKEPLLGMGLLLDKNCMPITMELYPGNESEKPMLKRCIDEAKRQEIVINRTIRIADKGLNCAKNIFEALKEKDGYIFSKSIIQLSQKEKTWVDIEEQYEKIVENNVVIFKYKDCIDEFEYIISDTTNGPIKFKAKEKRVVYWSKRLADKKLKELNKMEAKINDLILSKAKREQYNSYAPYISFKGIDKNGEITEKTQVIINHEKIEKDKKYAGYNMIITSEVYLDDKQIYDIYHHLWKIEESFRILKTDLDARPVYLQKPNEIFGHFLVCYLSIVLIRILQNIIFEGKLKVSEIFNFIREFKVIEYDDNLMINTLKANDTVVEISKRYSPIIEYATLNSSYVEKLKNVKLFNRRTR